MHFFLHTTWPIPSQWDTTWTNLCKIKCDVHVWTNSVFSASSQLVSLFAHSSTRVSQRRIHGLPLTVDKTGKDAEWQPMGGGGCLSVFHLLHSLHWAHTCRGLTTGSEQFMENNSKKKNGLKKAFHHFGWLLYFLKIESLSSHSRNQRLQDPELWR